MARQHIALPDHDTVFRNTLTELLDNTPKALTDIYGAEDSTRQVYTDRFLFELLQNARDAAARSREKKNPRVRILLQKDALLVANDGSPFDLGGYEAVTGISKSQKKNDLAVGGGRLIGKKGIGFKSVLRVSRYPQIFANDPNGGRFAIEFGTSRLIEIARAAVGNDELRLKNLLSEKERYAFDEEMARLPLSQRSLTRNRDQRGMNADELLSHLPVMMFPLWSETVPIEVQQLLGWGDFKEDSYDTVIRLPLDPEVIEEVKERIREDILPEKILFLGTLAEVVVEDQTEDTARCIQVEWEKSCDPWRARVHTNEGAHASEQDAVWEIFSSTEIVPLPTGETEDRTIQIAVPLEATGQIKRMPPQPLFNYYPLVDEGPVCGLLIHAEFEVDPGRTKFSADHAELNRALLKGIRKLLFSPEKGVVANILAGGAKGRAEMPAILLPRPTERPLMSDFRDLVLASLREGKVVPTSNGSWALPENVRVHPILGEEIAKLMGEWSVNSILLPEAGARMHSRFSEACDALRIGLFSLEDLKSVLRTGLSSQWKDPGDFQRLYQILQHLAAHENCGDPFEEFRLGGEGPFLPLVPCRSSDGVEVLPLPRRRQAGGQTTEKLELIRSEIQVFHLGGVEMLEQPPSALKLQFLDPLAMGSGGELRGLVEGLLGIPAYETLSVLRRISDVEPGSDCGRELARFIFAFLVRAGDNQWSLLSDAVAGSHPSPAHFFPGFPDKDASEVRAARIGLSRIFLPDSSGEVRHARDLRFSQVWGDEYADLDLLNPRSAKPVADEKVLIEYLDVENALKQHFPDERRRAIDALGEGGSESRTGTLLARAFARLCGVWETVPIAWGPADLRVGIDPSEIIKELPESKGLLGKLPDISWNCFGRENTYRHQNTRVKQSWWLSDLSDVVAYPERGKPLLRLLARDWESFFSHLTRLQLVCTRCADRGRSHSYPMTNENDSAVPSVLLWQLKTVDWYRPRDGRAIALDKLWLIPDPPEGTALMASPFNYLPHVRERDPGALQVFASMGVPWFNDAPVMRYLDLLDDLRMQFEEGLSQEVSKGISRVSFIALHREIYARLQVLLRVQSGSERFGPESVAESIQNGELFDGKPRHFTKEDWERLTALPILAERDGKLFFVPVEHALIDYGGHSLGRHLFRNEASFACVDERGRGIVQVLGGLPFELLADPNTGSKERDVSGDCHAALEVFLPDLVAVLGRIAPAGGMPLELEGDEFRRRLSRMRATQFIHCDDLTVRYTVKGRYGEGERPCLGERIAGKGSEDVHLDLQTDSPRILFDLRSFRVDDPNRSLPEFARAIASIFQIESLEYLFALLLQKQNPDERLRFLEERGIMDSDLDRARQAVGLQDRLNWDNRVAVVRILERILNISVALPNNRGTDTRAQWSAWQQNCVQSGNPLKILVADVAGDLLEHLKDSAADSPLAKLENAKVDLHTLSHELTAEGFEPISIRLHAERLRNLRDFHRETLIAGLHYKNLNRTQVISLVDEAFKPKESWTLKVNVPDEDLVRDLKDLLGLYGFSVPLPGITRAEYRAQIAQALNLSEAEFAHHLQQTFSDEEREAQQRSDFERSKRSFRNVLMGLRIRTVDLRNDQIQSLEREWINKIIFPGRDADLSLPFLSWLELSFEAVLASKTWKVLTDGGDIEAICELLQLDLNTFRLLTARIARVLDVTRLRRIGAMREILARYPNLEASRKMPLHEPSNPLVPGTVTPNTPSGGDDPGSSKRIAISRGRATEDEAERQRRGRLGAQGEEIAFAWATQTVRTLFKTQHEQFVAAIKSLREILDHWDLSDDLCKQFDGAVETLLLPELQEDELLDALQQLTHVSGEFASDSFGFDMIAWLPDDQGSGGQVLLIEVKTGRRKEDAFHLSQNQFETASRFKAAYAVLRVLIPQASKSRPELRLLLDPVGLSCMSIPGLMFSPNEYNVSEIFSVQ